MATEGDTQEVHRAMKGVCRQRQRGYVPRQRGFAGNDKGDEGSANNTR